MKFKRVELLKVLQSVQPGIFSGGDELVAQSTSFVFADDKVFTYNGEIAVSHPLKFDIEGAVPAKEFYALINKSKTEDVSFKLEGNELLLSGSKAKAGLRFEKEIQLPIDSLEEPDKWVELPENFCTALQACLFSASRNEAHAVLTCLHVIDTTVESCDNFRITQYDMGKAAKKVFPDELLIPGIAVKSLIAHDPVEYALLGGWLHFRNEADATFSCRCFEGEFPDYTPFMEVEGDTIELPDTLPEALDRAGIMGDGERVSLILDEDEIIVTTEKDLGWFEESVEAVYKGEPAEFDIQPEFMKSIIKMKGVTTVGTNAIRFDSDNFVHVVKIMAPKAKKK